MLSSIRDRKRHFNCRLAWISFAVAALLLAGFAASASAVVKGAVKQAVFESPEEAVKAFFDAIRNKDERAISAILGPGSDELIHSGDPVVDAETGAMAVKVYEEKHEMVKMGDNKVILELGKNNWPFPIPIRELKGKWYFDTKSGKEEILSRRIGRNELGVIQACLAYVDAQREYASGNYSGDGVPQYAQEFLSDPGKQNGLYWDTTPNEKPSPVGLFLANAQIEGYKQETPDAPYHGYYYRILKAQGKNAPGGAFSYVHKGKMVGGFALIASPARYGASGIMTFMVNHDGKVYQKDFGPRTNAAARAIKIFDPDRTWQEVK
ncbi:MAG: DUF2950 domain-containing protein [Desulfobacteraceae bacterium]|nr:DUF2950 domain-containing protein [Desulfobacteraceae bacterium]